jgi:hypothetical protein
MDNLPLWEIYVPVASNQGERYADDYHKKWDAAVRELTGGLTIFKKARGQWVGDSGLYVEEMIPVRIRCPVEVIRSIGAFTLRYYDQKAVFFSKVSDESYIMTLDDIVEG